MTTAEVSDERLAEMISAAMACDKWPADISRIVDIVTENDGEMSTEQAVALGILLSQQRRSSVVTEGMDEAEERRIDLLRLHAFNTNSPADRQAYFDAASKWFQDRHYRRMTLTAALSSQGQVEVEADEYCEQAASDALDFVLKKLPAIKKEKGLVGVWMNAWRLAWALSRSPSPGEREAVAWPPIVDIGRVLGFFASVIKSGEPWTETCQREYGNANAALQSLYASLSHLEAVERERDASVTAALEAEDEAKDCFWAIYADYLTLGDNPVSTETARTELAARAITAEAQVTALTAEQDALIHDNERYIEANTALVKRVGDLEGALSKAASRFDVIRGAVESNQVVDKDVHGTAVAARDAARSVLAGGEG